MSADHGFATLDELPPNARGHPLAPVDGTRVGDWTLRLRLGPRIVGGRYFRVDLEDGKQLHAFVSGLSNSGVYPGHNWIEVFDLELPPDVRTDEAGRDLARYLEPLAGAVPPGGHVMVEYESKLWRTTQLGLLAGIPPLATPLGALLFDIGCGNSFKDWYFPEGGQEGGRKLQGNKALDASHAREAAQKRAAELQEFLDGPPRGNAEIDARARHDAERILRELL